MRNLPIIRTILVLTLVTLIAVPYSAHAQDTQYKIGVVDLKKVFDGYEKQAKLYEDLKVERDTLQKPIDALSKSIEVDREKYEKEGKDMPEADRIALKEKIETNFSEYQLKLKQSQEKIDRKEKSIFEEIIMEIQKSVEEVGAKENYHLIFDGAKGRNNSLLYSSTTLNMTQKVIDHLNSK
jgi:Skp family chaperone for outer membrane proteins